MNTLHIVTEHFPPEMGGLELWTKQLADSLTANEYVRVVVHVVGDIWPGLGADDDVRAAYDVVSIAQARQLILEPIRASNWAESRMRKEYDRASYLSLLNSVGIRASQSPLSKHVLLSNFATGVGFAAAAVAEKLEIPHIVRLAGTDWSRGMRTPLERTQLLNTLYGASHVVALNGEQRVVLGRHIETSKITLIYTSIGSMPERVHIPICSDFTIEVFADCGFSHKKATHILLSAFAKVAAGSHRVRLTLVGPDERGQETYWQSLRTRYEAELGDAVCFPGVLDRSAVISSLSTCALYCSATLAEGCSLARIAALCVGVPIVTTSSGEMPDLATEMAHVKLVPPEDAASFSAALLAAVKDIAAGNMKVDDHQVHRCRIMFSPAREAQQWNELLASV
jgi:glycosyltransferase involved in cell wall biosynthesis